MDLDEERSAIRSTWERGNRALESGDWEAYEDLWAHGERVEVIHPDQREWLTGWERVGGSYRQLFEEGPSIEARTWEMRIHPAPSGKMAWATLKAELTYGAGADQTTVTVWETVVFEKIDGAWKLVHGHVSRPVSP